MIETVVIPAAGFGTRMFPASKVVTKEMLNIYDRPMIEYAVEEALATGAQRVVVVGNPRNIDLFRHHFGEYPDLYDQLIRVDADAYTDLRSQETHDRLHFVVDEYPSGLQGSILKAAPLIGQGPCGIILPDMISPSMHFLADMERRRHEVDVKAVISVGKLIDNSEVSSYGMVFERDGVIGRIVEKPKPLEWIDHLTYANGRYLLPGIWLKSMLQYNTFGQTLNLIAQATSMKAFEHPRVEMFDVGSLQGLAKANLHFAQEAGCIIP